jgi:hypothetical protein
MLPFAGGASSTIEFIAWSPAKTRVFTPGTRLRALPWLRSAREKKFSSWICPSAAVCMPDIVDMPTRKTGLAERK